MIKKIVINIASQMKTELTDVVVIDGEPVGCSGVFLVRLYDKSKIENTLIFSDEFEDLLNGNCSKKVRDRIYNSLCRLKSLETSN
jgi:hypothetical protein